MSTDHATSQESASVRSQQMRADMAGYYALRAKLGDTYQIPHAELKALDAEVEMVFILASLREFRGLRVRRAEMAGTE